MIKKVLILGGGISKERLISIQTAKAVLGALKGKNYKAIICEPDENLSNRKLENLYPPIIILNSYYIFFF